MNKRYLIFFLLLTFFAIAVLLAISKMEYFGSTLTYLDSAIARNSIRIAGTLEAGEPPLVFLILSIFNTLGVSQVVAGAILYALGIFTMYILANRLMGNHPAIVASLLIIFSFASLLLVYRGYWKQSFATTLTPIAVLTFWNAVKSPRGVKIVTAGLMLSIVGLTHQIAFGSLAIAYLGYFGFLTAMRKKIRVDILKVSVITVLISVPIIILLRMDAGAIVAAGEAGSKTVPFYRFPFSTLLTNFFAPTLLTFGVIGALAAAYRRKSYELFLLSWLLSSFILTMPWAGYRDRFELQMIIPLGLLAGNAIAFLKDYVFKISIPKVVFQKLAYFGIAFFIIFALISVTTTHRAVDPLVHVPSNFSLEIFPISIIGHTLSGIPSALLKFAIGIPLTIFFWVLTVRLLYPELKRRITARINFRRLIE